VWCVKTGPKYPADYVNCLARMTQRHLRAEHTFHCMTDDPRGLDVGIAAAALPTTDLGGCWNKLRLFSPGLVPPPANILYLDLDVVVTGPLDPLAAWLPEETFVGQPDWNRPWFPQFNSSVMRFTAGAHEPLHGDFLRGVDTSALVRGDEWDATTRGYDKTVYRRGWRRFGSDQEWISSRLRRAGGVRRRAFPPGWVVSYKTHARRGLPPDARIVVFHGSPKPHEVDDPFVREHWR